jgi:hypothetical protein
MKFNEEKQKIGSNNDNLTSWIVLLRVYATKSFTMTYQLFDKE